MHVTNGLVGKDAQGFALHMHGFLQRGTPWYDGVPGVSQCPIAPGQSFTYKFRADQYGTTWYHSHYGGQYNDGAFGPLVVYGPVHKGAEYDHDLGTFMFKDHYHITYEQNRADAFQRPPAFKPIDNNLLNDVGCDESSGNCTWATTKLPTYRFQSGKKYRLRLVNPSSASSQHITFDNHKMTIIADDFVPIVPYTTDHIVLGIGQRADVVVEATGKSTDAVYLRGDIDVPCSNTTAINPQARGVFLYQDAKPDAVPGSKPTGWQENGCKGDPIGRSVPFYKKSPPGKPDTVADVNVDFIVNATGYGVFTVDKSTFHTDYNSPALLHAFTADGENQRHPTWNVQDFGSNSSVRLVFYNYATFVHPMHLHGHTYWVLDEGFGQWDGTVKNPSNPTRRDTVLVPPGFENNPAYMVLEFVADNPGIWPFHCHVSLHTGYGLLLNVLVCPRQICYRFSLTTQEQSKQLRGNFGIAKVMAQTCPQWEVFAQTHKIDQIDSGV